MDNIHPDHYKKETSLECIDAMKIMFGDAAVADFCICNAFKYIWRWKNKNGKEDLHKAKWYLNSLALLGIHGYDISDEYTNFMDRMNYYIATKLDEDEDGCCKEV